MRHSPQVGACNSLIFSAIRILKLLEVSSDTTSKSLER